MVLTTNRAREKMMSGMRVFLLILIVIGTSLLLFASTAAADGPPCSFSGTIKLDDSATSGRTLITATIEGDEYHAYATEAYSSSRYYYLTIRAPVGKEYSDGTKITFKISGYSADQTATYKAGLSTKLDLTASSIAVASPVNAWLTPLLALLLSAAFGIACYFLIRMMVRRRRLARPVTAVQAHKVEAQPLSRYVWDNAKLAWVENKRQVKSKPPIKKS
jgi:hypothetical protein